MAYNLAKLGNLEQVNLKDNCLGNESSDELLFLVKKQKALWRLNINLNMIKHVSLIEIEKQCKRNKQYAKMKGLPEIKREIKRLEEDKEPGVLLD